MRSALLCASFKELYFYICQSGKSADFPDWLFHGRGTPSGADAPAPPRGSLRALPKSFPLLLKPSPWGRWIAAKRQDGRGNPAVSLHDPTCENGTPERPQTLRGSEIINNSSADHAQSECGAHSKSSRRKGAYSSNSRSLGWMRSSSAAGSAIRRRLWLKMAFSSVLRARRPLPAVRLSSA